MLIHLPREDGYGVIPRTKNGPALAGYGAITMKKALASAMTALPEQLRRSLTWDRGKELSQHTAFKVETGIAVSITVNDKSEPVAENLRVTDQGTSWIELAWDELSDPDVNAEHWGVAVFESPPTPSSFYAESEVVCCSYRVTGLVSDTAYYIMIMSVAADGTRLDVLTLTASTDPP